MANIRAPAEVGLVAGLAGAWIAARLFVVRQHNVGSGQEALLAAALGRKLLVKHMIGESSWSLVWSGLGSGPEPWRSTDSRVRASDLWSGIKGPRLRRGWRPSACCSVVPRAPESCRRSPWSELHTTLCMVAEAVLCQVRRLHGDGAWPV